jgi:riboflavin biosynthesis pyrimidine reductase
LDNLIHLWPLPASERPLQGTYLAHDIRQYAAESGKPFVYSNFVTSVDGRIAIPRAGDDGMTVPKDTANERDWRLFQELAAQADIIISSGRYLRDWAAGRAQEILRVDDPRFADLRTWRAERGLKPLPDIAIISRSLDFPIPDVLTAGGRQVVVVTVAGQDAARVDEIEAKAGRVIIAGQKGVDGAEMVRQMAEMGYQTVYSASGPKVLHLLLTANVLNRLYLTSANRLLGGRPFSSIVEGPLLEPAYDLQLSEVSLDPAALDGLGQLLLTYDRA